MANLLKIRELCIEKNIQLKVLAQKADISEAGLQDIFKRNSTKTEILERISKVLDVPVGFFFESSSTEIASKADETTVGSLPHENEIQLLRQRIAGLEKELQSQKEVIKAKEEIISLLRELGKR